MWIKSANTSESDFAVHFETDIGHRMLAYVANWTGAQSFPDGAGYIGVDGTAGDFDEGHWVRLERDLQADIELLWPGEELVRVRGLHAYADDAEDNTISWTNLRFSNAVTTRSSLLSPGGAIGHVARARTIDPVDWSVDDAYPHYDQVGSVVAATGADGLAATRREADAWGNDLASWSTGLWAAPAGGWGHNTKAFDPAADLVYMYQRWYDPKTGTFASSAPYPPMIEHRYGFAENNPVMMVDPDGRDAYLVIKSLKNVFHAEVWIEDYAPSGVLRGYVKFHKIPSPDSNPVLGREEIDSKIEPVNAFPPAGSFLVYRRVLSPVESNRLLEFAESEKIRRNSQGWRRYFVLEPAHNCWGYATNLFNANPPRPKPYAYWWEEGRKRSGRLPARTYLDPTRPNESMLPL